MFMKKRVLVVGANGFIGYNLVNELISNEIPVTALIKINSDTTNLKKIGCYNIIRTNNFEDPTVLRTLSLSQPNFIVNCTWEKNKDLGLQFENTQNLLSLLKLAKKINSNHFINLGSYLEYGIYKDNINEETFTTPISEFGKLKLAHSNLLFEIAKSFNLKASHLRLSNVYSLYKPDNLVFHNLIKLINGGSNSIEPINIKKTDFIFVSDVCRAIIAIMKSNVEGIFNIGSGEAYPIETLIKMIIQQLNSSFIPEFKKNKQAKDYFLNIEKIYKNTGWKPSISIWNGLSLIIQEEKFKNPSSYENFTSTIRSMYK